MIERSSGESAGGEGAGFEFAHGEVAGGDVGIGEGVEVFCEDDVFESVDEATEFDAAEFVLFHACGEIFAGGETFLVAGVGGELFDFGEELLLFFGGQESRIGPVFLVAEFGPFLADFSEEFASAGAALTRASGAAALEGRGVATMRPPGVEDLFNRVVRIEIELAEELSDDAMGGWGDIGKEGADGAGHGSEFGVVWRVWRWG